MISFPFKKHFAYRFKNCAKSAELQIRFNSSMLITVSIVFFFFFLITSASLISLTIFMKLIILITILQIQDDPVEDAIDQNSVDHGFNPSCATNLLHGLQKIVFLHCVHSLLAYLGHKFFRNRNCILQG